MRRESTSILERKREGFIVPAQFTSLLGDGRLL